MHLTLQTETHLPRSSSYIISVTTGLKAKLILMLTLLSPSPAKSSTILLLSGYKSKALWLRRHRRASLSARVASLLSIHMHTSLPKKGPVLWKNDGTAESERRFLSQKESQSWGARLALAFSDTLMSEKDENNVDRIFLNLKGTFLKFTTTLKPLTD